MRNFGYAFDGLWYALRTQRNMRVHISIALLAVLVGLLLRISPVEFAIIFHAIICVFTAEMFNTVLEICVDLASPAYHPIRELDLGPAVWANNRRFQAQFSPRFALGA